MTEKDKKLIEEAYELVRKSSDGWIFIDENEADTEEARDKLHTIAMVAYHREEYSAGCL